MKAAENLVIDIHTVVPRYNAPRYNADLAITRLFIPKGFLPHLLSKGKFSAKIIIILLKFLVKIHKFQRIMIITRNSCIEDLQTSSEA